MPSPDATHHASRKNARIIITNWTCWVLHKIVLNTTRIYGTCCTFTSSVDSTLAPFCSRTLMASVCPPCAAHIKAVFPSCKKRIHPTMCQAMQYCYFMHCWNAKQSSHHHWGIESRTTRLKNTTILHETYCCNIFRSYNSFVSPVCLVNNMLQIQHSWIQLLIYHHYNTILRLFSAWHTTTQAWCGSDHQILSESR